MFNLCKNQSQPGLLSCSFHLTAQFFQSESLEACSITAQDLGLAHFIELFMCRGGVSEKWPGISNKLACHQRLDDGGNLKFFCALASQQFRKGGTKPAKTEVLSFLQPHPPATRQPSHTKKVSIL